MSRSNGQKSRSNVWKLKLDKFRLEIRHIFLTMRMINHWNNLPRWILSIGDFKIKIRCLEDML